MRIKQEYVQANCRKLMFQFVKAQVKIALKDRFVFAYYVQI